jgi:hypothetical protein
MKKQLLIAAIAATMGTAVIADVAITGHAKYVYKNTETSGTTGSLDSALGEVNLVVDGSHGDTKLHIEQEFNMTGVDNGNIDAEDVWMSTKVGDFGIKLGAWDGSTTAITGSILNNARSAQKVYVTTSVADVNLGYWTTPGGVSSEGFTANTTVGGVKIELKDSVQSFTAIRVSGEVAGLSLSHENLDSDTAGKDATMTSAAYTYNGVTLKADQVRADQANGITEDDGIFQQYDEDVSSTGANAGTDITKITQLSASMDIAGNKVTLYAIEGIENVGTKNNATKIKVSRALAGGTNIIATYTDAENDAATTDTETFTAELNVKF